MLRSTTSTSTNIKCTNGVDPCTVTDPLTGRSDQVTNIESSAKSWYDALLVSLQKRPTGGHNFRWGFNLNYTLSKTLDFSNDDQIPFNGAEDQVDLIERTNNLRLEKSYSPTDERHRGVFYGLFEVPWHISISPIWTIASHLPMDSLVPTLSSRLPIIPRNALGREISNGAQLNAAIDLWNSLPTCTDHENDGQKPDDFDGLLKNLEDIEITLERTPLTADPRVLLRHVSFQKALNPKKTFALFNERRLQCIGEVFNLFNITNIRGFNNNNYSGFNNDITSSHLNQAVSTAGGFFGSGGPRAFQLALRYSF